MRFYIREKPIIQGQTKVSLSTAISVSNNSKDNNGSKEPEDNEDTQVADEEEREIGGITSPKVILLFLIILFS